MIDDALDVHGYIERKGWVVVKREKGKSGNHSILKNCPLCGAESSRSKRKFYINTDSGMWNCYGCDRSGNLLTLKKDQGDLDMMRPSFSGFGTSEAGKMSERLRKARGSSSWKRSNSPPERSAPFYHARLIAGEVEGALDYLMVGRGLKRETIDQFQIGVARRGFCRKCEKRTSVRVKEAQDLCPTCGDVATVVQEMIALPYKLDGRVLNFKFRSLTGEKRFEMWGEGAADFPFNLDSLDGEYKVVAICEAEFDAITMAQIGYSCVISTGGATKNLDDEVVERLALFDDVLLAQDADEAGHDASEKTAQELGRYRCRRVKWPMKDANDCLAAGMTRDELCAYVDAAISYQVNAVKPFAEYAEDLRRMRDKGPRLYGRQTQWLGLNSLLAGFRDGEMTVITGDTGCLAGDTIVKVNRAGKGFTIELSELVRRFNGGKASGKVWNPEIPTFIQSMTEAGWWGLAQVVRAVVSGIQDFYSIEFSNGSILNATADHKILLESGRWSEVRDLDVGDYVQCKVDAKPRTDKKACKQYKYRAGLRNHPFATRRSAAHSSYRVVLHRLVIEADRNGVELGEWLTMLRSDEAMPDGYSFLSPSQIVHHVDEDRRNNNLDNLLVISEGEHKQIHAREAWKNFGLQLIGRTKIKSIVSIGKLPSYDLTVAGTHNYIANGIVTHNSGKTTWTLAAALDQAMGDGEDRDGVGVLVASFEVPIPDVCRKLVCMNVGKGFRKPEPNKPDAGMTDDEFEDSIRELGSKSFYFVDQYGEMAISDLRDAIEYGVRRYKLWFVVLDHLHFFLPSGGNDERKIIDDAIRTMKKWAVRLGIHIALVVHPSKLRTDQNGKILKVELNDLKGASSIKQDTDNVIRVWRPRGDDYDPDIPPYAEIAVLKVRSDFGCEGEVTMGFDTVSMRYDYSADPNAYGSKKKGKGKQSGKRNGKSKPKPPPEPEQAGMDFEAQPSIRLVEDGEVKATLHRDPDG